MKKFILLLFGITLITSCVENTIGQYPIDNVPPRKLTSVNIENIEGGAIITYEIPADEDALYVKANYLLEDGTPMEIKSSMYSNKIEIVGIGKTREVEVILTVVDRSQNESEPLKVLTYPLDATIHSILKSVTIQNDFGGIFIKWTNPSKTPIVIDVLSPGPDKEFIEIERFYSESLEGKANIRGQEPIEKIFALVIKDRWGNVTDTISGTYLPIFETELEKTKFRRWNPPGIPYNAYTTSNWYIENLWNNNIKSGFANYALEFTFDLGQIAKLSRFKIHQRPESNLIYNYVSPKRFELWGSTTPNVSSDFNTWQYIGTFESIKPSGLPLGQVSNEDIEYAHVKGEEWNVPLEAPQVRYIRFVTKESWGQGNVVQLMEISIWGSPENN